MSIWNAIAQNPDAVLGIIGAALSLLGVKRWRTAVRDSAAIEVDRWATTVAAAMVLAIKSGLFKAHEDAMAHALRRFRVLAQAAGVRVKPEHETKALATIHKTLVAAGQEALIEEAMHMHRLAESAMERLSRLPWPKDEGR